MRTARLRSFVPVLVIGGTAMSSLIAGTPAQAGSTLTVTNQQNSGSGSLRDELAAAASGDTVTFASSVRGTITVLSPLDPPDGVTITGPGARLLTVSGGDTTTILEVASGRNVTVSGLTFAHGYATDPQQADTTVNGAGGGNAQAAGTTTCIEGSNGAGGMMTENPSAPAAGGAINNAGGLTLTSVRVTDSHAVGSRGADATAHGGTGGEGSNDFECGAPGGKGGSVTVVAAPGNEAAGGGIYTTGALDLIDSTIDHDVVTGGDGGTATAHGGDGGDGQFGGSGGPGGDASVTVGAGGNAVGGGLAVASGAVTMTNTTIGDNASQVGTVGNGETVAGSVGVPYPGASQGGNPGATTVNQPAAGPTGVGGVWVAADTAVTLDADTVANNRVARVDGAAANLGVETSASVSLTGTLVAEPGAAANCYGMAGANYSMSDDSSCPFTAASDKVKQAAHLGALGNNGGPVDTMALSATSPAVDASSSPGIHTDARGDQRPVDFSSVANAAGGDGSDIGAYERQQPPSTTITARPAHHTTKTSATIRFHGSRSAVSFQCKVDHGHWKTCRSPLRLHHLHRARHLVEVRSLDASRIADPTPSKVAWVITQPAKHK